MAEQNAAHSTPKAASPVLLSRNEADEVARLLRILLEGQDGGAAYDSSAVPRLPDRARLQRLAQQVYLARRARSGFFSRGLDGEPAWDMLLALYARDAVSAAHTTAQTAEFSVAAPSTALRWIDYLCDQGLLAKEPSPADRRLTLVRLTSKARAQLDSYFALILQNGLGT